MSQEYNNLLQDVMTQCPSSIPLTIEPELAMVLRDFLQQTSAWKCRYAIPVDKVSTCYVLEPPPGAAINLLHNIYDSTDPEQRTVSIGGFSMSTPGIIRLKHPSPQEATWVAVVSMYPVRNASGANCKALVPSWILDRYYDTLLHGILGRMMRQLMKPYTNAAMGTLHGASYGAGRSTAKADLARSNVWGTQQWIYPPGNTAHSRQVGP